MYTDYYQLREKPFAIEPNARFIVLSEDQKEALATLVYAIEEQEGWALLLGEPGIGKTTMIKALLQHLGDQVIPAVITNPRLEPLDFLNSLALELGLPGPFTSKGPFLVAMRNLISRCRQEKRVLLILVDEAQSLPSEMLEEIRLLGNVDDGSPRVLNIFLVAQPELLRNLKKAGAKALMQRFRRYHLLKPLSEEETALYVLHRLEVAGAQRPVFDESALTAVYEVANGNPRLTNAVCDDAMLAGMARGQEIIDGDLVREAAMDDPSLEWSFPEEPEPPVAAPPAPEPVQAPAQPAVRAAATAPESAPARIEAPAPAPEQAEPPWPDVLFEEAGPDQVESGEVDTQALSQIDQRLSEMVEEVSREKKGWFRRKSKPLPEGKDDLYSEKLLEDSESAGTEAGDGADIYEDYQAPVKKGALRRLAGSMSKDAPGSLWKRAVALCLVAVLLVGGYFLGKRYWRPVAMRLGLAGPMLLMPEDDLSLREEAQRRAKIRPEGPPDWGPTLRPKASGQGATGGLNG